MVTLMLTLSFSDILVFSKLTIHSSEEYQIAWDPAIWADINSGCQQV